MGQSVRSHMPEENWFFPSASSHQLPILMVGLFEAISHSYWVFDQLGHVQVLCIANPAPVTHEYNDPASSRKHCFRLVFDNLWLWRSFCPFFCDGPLTLRECDADVPDRADYSIASYFLCFDQLGVSVLVTKRGFSEEGWVLSGAFIYEYKDK